MADSPQPRRAQRWILVVLLLAALAAAAAAAYTYLAPDRYVATAEILVTPVDDSPAYEGLPVLRSDAPNDRRPVETVARLVESGSVAEVVTVRLRFPSREAALDAVDAEAEAAGIVAVRGEAGEAARAAQIANAFAEAVVQQRDRQFQETLRDLTRRLSEQLAQVPGTLRDEPPASDLSRRLAQLRLLEGMRDPSVELVGTAVAPDRAERPRPEIVVPAAGGAVLVLGLTALAFGALARRRPAPGAEPALLDRLERAIVRLETDAQAAPARVVDPELIEREALLEGRIAAVTEREREMVRQRAELAARERELDERAGAADGRVLDVERRRRELQERDEALTAGRQELERRKRELETHERELETRERELETQAEERAAMEAAAAAAPPPEPQLPSTIDAGAYNLGVLERLVADHGGDFPDQHDEWQQYLVSLRPYAAPDGRLPSSFDALVDEAFGSLLDARG